MSYAKRLLAILFYGYFAYTAGVILILFFFPSTGHGIAELIFDASPIGQPNLEGIVRLTRGFHFLHMTALISTFTWCVVGCLRNLIGYAKTRLDHLVGLLFYGHVIALLVIRVLL